MDIQEFSKIQTIFVLVRFVVVRNLVLIQNELRFIEVLKRKFTIIFAYEILKNSAYVQYVCFICISKTKQ